MSAAAASPSPLAIRLRLLAIAAVLAASAIVLAGQLVRLGLSGAGETRFASAEPIARSYARPDIVDRNGRLIAIDVPASSLFADPALILDRDEVAEKLALTLPGIEAEELRRQLADRSRRFVWIRRGLAPVEAQRVHDLGLPGLAFRREPKRVYPAGDLVGHVIGQVTPENRGIAGLERHLDELGAAQSTVAATPSATRAVRLTLDLGAQHVLVEELGEARARYRATAAAGLVLDAATGAIVAAATVPTVDPNVAGAHLDAARPDRLQAGVYELGSIMKAFTVAMALDDGTATLARTLDVTRRLVAGGHTIRDLHPPGHPLDVRDVFLRSSNVGSAMLALEAGAWRQLLFLARLGLTEPVRTEAGPIAPPLLPPQWGEAETATIAYGHGLAVAPLQVAAAAATLVNGGYRVTPTWLADRAAANAGADRERVLKAATSEAMRELMRLNVTRPSGTGRRAEATGYRLGGKTGTAEMASRGGYRERAVIASFLGALPMEAPRYVLLVSLHEPQATEETAGGITAGLNAAPVAGAIVARMAPILGLLPRRIDELQ